MLEFERILRLGLSSLLTCPNNFYVRVLLEQEGVEKQECVVQATSNWISPTKGQSTKAVSKWKSEHVSVRVGKEGFSSA